MSIAASSTVAAISGAYWQWRGQSIYYVKVGTPQPGRSPLLLVHGFGASTDHWRKNLEGLQSEFEVWAIDLLGFGRSAKPDWQYSGELWREQLHDFIAEVVGQPAFLAGNSLGGYAILTVAAQYPDALRGLILLNSAGPFSDSLPPAPSPLQKLTKRILLSPWASYLIFQYSRRRSTIRKTLQKVYLDPSAVTERLVEEIYRPSCDRGAVKVFASVFKSPRGETVDALLARCGCPILLLWGEGDPWMKVRDRAAKFRQYYDNLSEQFLQAGHCPHDEIPEIVNREIARWIGRQENPLLDV